MRAGWWRRLFQEAPLSGMHTPSCARAHALHLDCRCLWQREPRGGQGAVTQAPCLPGACAWLPCVVVGGPQGRWVVSVSLLGGLRTKKVFKKKKKVWYQSLCLSDCPGFQQPGFLLVIGTAVFRWWAQSGEASSSPCHRVSSQDK